MWPQRKKVLNDQAASILVSQLAPQLIHICAAIAPVVHNSVKDDVPLDAPDQMLIERELLFFCVHLVDRAAFREFGDGETRHKLVDNLGRTVFDSFVVEKCGYSGDTPTYIESALAQLNERQQWLAQFTQLVPARGKQLKGALLWEFSKHLALKFTHNPIRATLVCNPVTGTLELVDKTLKGYGWKGLVVPIPN